MSTKIIQAPDWSSYILSLELKDDSNEDMLFLGFVTDSILDVGNWFPLKLSGQAYTICSHIIACDKKKFNLIPTEGHPKIRIDEKGIIDPDL